MWDKLCSIWHKLTLLFKITLLMDSVHWGKMHTGSLSWMESRIPSPLTNATYQFNWKSDTFIFVYPKDLEKFRKCCCLKRNKPIYISCTISTCTTSSLWLVKAHFSKMILVLLVGCREPKGRCTLSTFTFTFESHIFVFPKCIVL